MGGGNFSFFPFFFLMFCLFLFLLLAAGRSPGTLSLLQSSDWNRVSHPGCQGTRCHTLAAVALGPVRVQVVGAGAALPALGSPFFLPQYHKNLFLPPKSTQH